MNSSLYKASNLNVPVNQSQYSVFKDYANCVKCGELFPNGEI